MDNNLTILVVGPLNSISLDGLEYYKSLGKVILSYWETCENDILTRYDLTGVSCIRRKHPQITLKAASHYGTFTKQVYGIYNALSICDTEYIIKTRSDEVWYNLNPLIEKFNKDKDKIICGNIFFKKWSKFKWHIGDHLFIGKTKVINDGFRKILEDLYYDRVAEVTIAFGIMDALGMEKTKENFIKIFDVINIDELKPFMARWNQHNITYINKFEFERNSCIRSIEEL